MDPVSADRIILFEDLNCPFCYALGRVLRSEGLLHCVQWRGIQHAPAAPVPWTQPGPALRSALETEVNTVRRRIPKLAIVQPYGQPNTEFATLAVAQAMRTDEIIGYDLRDAIKEELWRGNRDISNMEMIERIWSTLNLPPLTLDDELRADARRWQAEWSAMPNRMIPVMRSPSGQWRRGLGDPEDAIRFVQEHTAPELLKNRRSR